MRLSKHNSRNRRRFAMSCGSQGFHYVCLDSSHANAKQRKVKTMEEGDKEKSRKVLVIFTWNLIMRLWNFASCLISLSKSKVKILLKFRYFHFCKSTNDAFYCDISKLNVFFGQSFTEVLRIFLFVTMKSFTYMPYFFS
jgi:hypothetical protein